uniref:DUF8040 domain-containing protein n=1 Tax=Arundo donax TaxID=35708 RepID=A0A0A9DG40_ARUDO
MFLHMVGHNLTNCVIGFYFKRSGETVSRYFSEVLKALCYFGKDMINLRSIETHPKIISRPRRFYPYFKVNRVKYIQQLICQGLSILLIKTSSNIGLHWSL